MLADTLKKIEVKDNGERLVYIKDHCPDISIDLAAYIMREPQEIQRQAAMVREGVVERLNEAQSYLPQDYRISINCGYRPLEVQKRIFKKIYLRNLERNPDWDEENLISETCRHVAHPDSIPPHSTGGAVDLTIIGPEGKPLNMGSPINKIEERTETFSDKISYEGLQNRKLLIMIMESAGFVTFPSEWWHWSYGDRYWAAERGCVSVYDKVSSLRK